jgi:hypothetical protein
MSDMRSRVIEIGTWLLLACLAIFVITLPGSPMRIFVEGRLLEWSTGRLIDAHWDELLSGSDGLSGYSSDQIVVAFVDFQCSACAAVHADARRARQAGWPIAMVYRHFPLTNIHPHAEGAARSAICADGQGMLNDMSDELYRSTDWHESADWVAVAERVGLPDLQAFERCLTSDATDGILRVDQDWAETFGVVGTPTFLFFDAIEAGYSPSGRSARMFRRQADLEAS